MAAIDNGVVKVVEVIGISNKSFDDAVAQAVKKASKSINGITGVEVLRNSAKVKNGKLVQFKANVKLAFAVK